ncbi:cytochrome C [Rubrivivax gelatinosus]|uniref:c-type cytochrome n=1 Tax=Rubrivivax gelatinosus TaxID=28068 RepID=UPI0019033F99|nr:cytochrome C [Rubrivivax gelatinosus]MBK1615238.1 cytochrome C [Rubrivivax gelatinosus]
MTSPLRPLLAALSAVTLALPAAARADEALAARSVAATCANCHGTDGHSRSTIKSLAGQPAERILQSLADFRSGAQPSTIMAQILRGYSDEQLRLAAQWFAAQPALPAPAR